MASTARKRHVLNTRDAGRHDGLPSLGTARSRRLVAEERHVAQMVRPFQQRGGHRSAWAFHCVSSRSFRRHLIAALVAGFAVSWTVSRVWDTACAGANSRGALPERCLCGSVTEADSAGRPRDDVTVNNRLSFPAGCAIVLWAAYPLWLVWRAAKWLVVDPLTAPIASLWRLVCVSLVEYFAALDPATQLVVAFVGGAAAMVVLSAVVIVRFVRSIFRPDPNSAPLVPRRWLRHRQEALRQVLVSPPRDCTALFGPAVPSWRDSKAAEENACGELYMRGA